MPENPTNPEVPEGMCLGQKAEFAEEKSQCIDFL